MFIILQHLLANLILSPLPCRTIVYVVLKRAPFEVFNAIVIATLVLMINVLIPIGVRDERLSDNPVNQNVVGTPVLS